MSVLGCTENIALIGRPTIPEGQPDVVGTVERIDTAARRIDLQLNGGERRSIGYTADAQVLERGREYPITKLAAGDRVAAQVRQNERGESYANLIRIQENAPRRNPERASVPAPKIQTLSGTVGIVNRRDNSFELNSKPGETVAVALSPNVRDSDRDRFSTLRSGDHVRVEGKFTNRDRFEMLSFLNNEY
jgi:hypothetical protein